MRKTERVLISERRIKSRIKALAAEIDRHYRGREIILIGVLNGSIIFLADLVRHLKTPLQLDSLSASSYGKRTSSSGSVMFDPNLKLNLRKNHVLVVDDILDTGNTISKIIGAVKALKPKSLELCVLLEKNIPRKYQINPRFVGFQIDNHFVYGYGLDYAERYRNLRDIVYKT